MSTIAQPAWLRRATNIRSPELLGQIVIMCKEGMIERLYAIQAPPSRLAHLVTPPASHPKWFDDLALVLGRAAPLETPARVPIEENRFQRLLNVRHRGEPYDDLMNMGVVWVTNERGRKMAIPAIWTHFDFDEANRCVWYYPAPFGIKLQLSFASLRDWLFVSQEQALKNATREPARFGLKLD